MSESKNLAESQAPPVPSPETDSAFLRSNDDRLAPPSAEPAAWLESGQAILDSSGRIILEPFAEIPAREKWLFENKDALDAVRDGLTQAAEGRTGSRGSFSSHANEEID